MRTKGEDQRDYHLGDFVFTQNWHSATVKLNKVMEWKKSEKRWKNKVTH